MSLPFTDYCEPSADSETTLGEVLQEVASCARRRGWNYIESRGSAGLATLFPDAHPSLGFYTHELDLRPGAETIFQTFENSFRRAIRKAEKSGVTVEFSSNPGAVRDYYTLHCQTRRQHGLPPQPFRFFQNIQKYVLGRNMGTVASARFEGRTVASAIFFNFGTEAIYKFGASDKAFQSMRANNLIMWAAIQWCIQQGAHMLQFGRTSLSNEGLRRFKLGWGSKEARLDYYKYDFRKQAFVTDDDNTIGWHTRAFQSLPIFLSRLAGAALYKHIA
ncbi:MAG: lipid II:glycine glycyltransferase FemX [Verrucomicrobiota bacterium]